MSTSTILPSNTPPRDKDLAEQARPGHGIPSQDPNPAAQVQLRPEEAEREANSALAGGGLVGGAAIGAAIGGVVGGPVGVVVGGSVGAVAGALGGAAVGTAINAGDSDSADPALDGSTADPRDQPAKASRMKP